MSGTRKISLPVLPAEFIQARGNDSAIIRGEHLTGVSVLALNPLCLECAYQVAIVAGTTMDAS